ncbi:MAG: DUF4446 family protein [Syntrophomonadaceae bacterium]|jgi:hypothetical protein|nr:DUF4446 family protein [Syntrophomonadaceae bacterium]MDH7496894.1 DUF4446 family protein [Syntrophomonadaceae bacterium]
MPGANWLAAETGLAGLLVVSLLLIACNLALIWRLRTTRRLVRQYEAMFADYHGDTVQALLSSVAQREQHNAQEIGRMQDRIEAMEARMPHLPWRMAVKRYKGFPDMGGDLSFSLALLSDEGNGVIITGLHGREESRVYAKPVQGNSSRYQLSQEELEVLHEALAGAVLR